MSARMLLYAGAVAGAGGLVVAGRLSRISGVCLVIAGLLFGAAARGNVASTFAPPEMPERNVRLINLVLGGAGVFFIGIGVALMTSLLGVT